MHAVGEHQALAEDTATVSHLLHLGVQPQVRVATLQWPTAERLHLLVQPLADTRDLALRDPQPQRLDHLVDLVGGDASDVRLLLQDERLLRALARLKKRREIAAPADLRDRQLDLAGARLPGPQPVAVAVREPLLGALPALGTDQLAHLGLHQLLHDQASDSRKTSSPSPSNRQPTTCSAVILFVSAIVVLLSSILDRNRRS